MRAVPVVSVIVAGVLTTVGYFDISHRRQIEREAANSTGGDPRRGWQSVETYGCAACHEFPGFAAPKAHVGPPLRDFGLRMYIGGVAENKPDALVHFLKNPREIIPKGAMPDLHVNDRDARDLAAYLYTLR